MSRFDTVLVANRGEIAVRVIRGAHRLGYRTVAVYSDADRDALHVRMADVAVRLGPAPAAESYLSIERLLEAARVSGAQAIHPGYGFLSERAAFAAAVQAAGLTFIGPDPQSIEAMGSKSASKRLMLAAGVPCVPGYQGTGAAGGDEQSDERLVAEARKIGLPVMIKAAAGGGGRGMRLVHHEAQLVEQIRSARSEATHAFGSGELLIEKAVVDARHVEIQVFGDCHGNVVHLGERDCSIQRRNQKVVEETPSPAVDDTLRNRMGEAAVAAARAVNYVGAGTVEFLLGADGAFYFLEMNTRLQVEHPVTELVYGVDLVEWQLRVAQGEALPMSQQQIAARRRGHAIEVRLCAEDPRQNYLPQTGPVLVWTAPTGEGLRTDSGLEAGMTISPHYDSMQAKIIAWGGDRDIARQRLIAALAETRLLGVSSNRDYLRDILASHAFASGDFSTGFVERHCPQSQLSTQRPSAKHRFLAAVALYLDDAGVLARDRGLASEWLGWHSSHATPVDVVLAWRDESHDIDLAVESGHFSATLDGIACEAEIVAAAPAVFSYRSDGQLRQAHYARRGDTLWLDAEGRVEGYVDRTYAAAEVAGTGSDGRVLAHSDGKIVAVHTAVGDVVSKGQTLLVLEAMKMEFQITSPVDGTVEVLSVDAGQQVRGRQLLVGVTPVA